MHDVIGIQRSTYDVCTKAKCIVVYKNKLCTKLSHLRNNEESDDFVKNNSGHSQSPS